MIGTGEHAQSHVLDVQVDQSTDMSSLRRRVDVALTDLGGDHRYDVLLVVTELVSNVLDHTIGQGRLRLVRTRKPCEIMIEVDDASSVAPVCGTSRLGDNRGRGIVMVDGMAHRWGTVLRLGGKTVFALLHCGGVGMAAEMCPVTP